MSALLRIEGLNKSFGGVRPLAEVDLDIPPGVTFGVIGPNGAGKTTLFNVLTGYIRPDYGRVVLSGREITGYPPHRIWRMGIGRTFQITHVFGSLTVLENVLIGIHSCYRRNLKWYWPSKGYSRDKAEGLLELVRLSPQRGIRPAALPLPDQKRLELAIALATEPRLLLLDEPTAGMGTADREGAFPDN